MTGPQWTEEQLRAAAPAEIEAALTAGQLNALLGRPVPPTPGTSGQLTDEQVAAMTPAQVADAFEAGQLNAVLGRPVQASPADGGVAPPQPATATYTPPPWLPAAPADSTPPTAG